MSRPLNITGEYVIDVNTSYTALEEDVAIAQVVLTGIIIVIISSRTDGQFVTRVSAKRLISHACQLPSLTMGTFYL
jgi:hypothetical protein